MTINQLLRSVNPEDYDKPLILASDIDSGKYYHVDAVEPFPFYYNRNTIVQVQDDYPVTQNFCISNGLVIRPYTLP